MPGDFDLPIFDPVFPYAPAAVEDAEMTSAYALTCAYLI